MPARRGRSKAPGSRRTRGAASSASASSASSASASSSSFSCCSGRWPYLWVTLFLVVTVVLSWQWLADAEAQRHLLPADLDRPADQEAYRQAHAAAAAAAAQTPARPTRSLQREEHVAEAADRGGGGGRNDANDNDNDDNDNDAAVDVGAGPGKLDREGGGGGGGGVDPGLARAQAEDKAGPAQGAIELEAEAKRRPELEVDLAVQPDRDTELEAEPRRANDDVDPVSPKGAAVVAAAQAGAAAAAAEAAAQAADPTPPTYKVNEHGLLEDGLHKAVATEPVPTAASATGKTPAEAPASPKLANVGGVGPIPHGLASRPCPGSPQDSPWTPGEALTEALAKASALRGDTYPLGQQVALWNDSASHAIAFVPDRYHMCHWHNVCYNPRRAEVVIPIADPKLRALMDEQLRQCFQDRVRVMHDWCKCFMPTTDIVIVPAENLAKTQRRSGHQWFFDTYVAGYHHGHWVEGTAFLAGLLRRFQHQVQKRTGIPPIQHIVIPKYRETMSAIESLFFAAAIYNSTATAPLFGRMLGGLTCFDWLSSTSVVVDFGVASHEVSAFRAYAYRTFHLDFLACPPARTAFLQRGNDVGLRPRSIVNLRELVTLMRQKGFVDVITTTTTGANSTDQQVCLFADSGLIVSSHSSQIINFVYSTPNSAFIELAAAYHNLDFYKNAYLLGLHYEIVLGQAEEDRSLLTSNAAATAGVACHAQLAQCIGRPMKSCFVPKALDPGPCRTPDYKAYQNAVKPGSFSVNLAPFAVALDVAVEKLHTACGGHWAGVTHDYRVGIPSAPLT